MEKEKAELLQEVRAKLESEGLGGLYVPGDCACSVDDLAPCGECEREDGEDYINGCDGGFKHIDPKRPEFWVISMFHTPPAQEMFDDLHAAGS